MPLSSFHTALKKYNDFSGILSEYNDSDLEKRAANIAHLKM